MNKHRTSTIPYRSVLPSSVSDIVGARDCFQQTCHRHCFTDDNQNRNDEPSRKRRNDYDNRSNKNFSLLTIYINNILLILIRLMILFLIGLIISFIFYYTISLIYSTPEKNRWKQIIHWFYQE